MNKFPDTFKPEIFAILAKMQKEKKTVKMDTIIDSAIPEFEYKVGKLYTFETKGYNVEELNQFIELIRSKIKISSVYCLIRVFAYNHSTSNREGCGNHAETQVSFHFKENQEKNSVKKHIRKKIIDTFSGEKCVIKLDKYPTNDVLDIQQELTKLGWDVTIVKDHWDHIHDDYCVVDLELKTVKTIKPPEDSDDLEIPKGNWADDV